MCCSLTGAPLAKLGATPLKAKVALQLVKSAPAAADWNVSFARPKGTATIGVTVGLATAYVNVVDGESSALVGIYDGGMKLPSPKPDHSGKGAVKADQLQLLPSDEELTMRVFVDADVLEVYCEKSCAPCSLHTQKPRTVSVFVDPAECEQGWMDESSSHQP
eukprot:SAG11_NODE_65_length_18798_cov_11.881224_10_plen_162_part_00